MMTHQTSYSDIANLQNQNNTAGNRNISSLLSQITDDGPDVNVSQKKGKRINIRSDDTNNGISQQQTAEQITPNPLDHLQKAQSQNNASQCIVKNNRASWLQFLMVFLVTIAMMFFLYRLDARTNHLEVSLNSLDDTVLDSIDSYSSELSPGFRSIKKTLKAVKRELEQIKMSTQNEKPSNNNTISEVYKSSPINDNIDIMEDEILILKRELKQTREKLKSISENSHQNKIIIDGKSSTAVNVATSLTTNSVNMAKTNGWVVNLASFTDRSKANKALAPLYAAGLSPLVQQVSINGSTAYRIIVAGFSSMDDANLFVRRAEHEFGLRGGWVRNAQ